MNKEFIKIASEMIFNEGINDEISKYWMESSDEITYEEIFDVMNDIGILDMLTQDDVLYMIDRSEISESDSDYIMDLKMIRDLELG
jgi:SUMO ligase MMS21 Smc5/6 complex component